jgi:hypothetical protein
MAGLDRARRAAVVTATVASVAALAAGCTGGTVPAAHPASPGTAAPRSPAASSARAVLPAGAQRRALAARYLAIAKAGNARLEIEFRRLHGPDRGHLAAAHRDLRDVAATERRFDKRLLGIAFPAGTERIAQFLYWVNQARASMTIAAASARSLTRLHADEQRLKSANAPVEQAVAMVRSQLGLPPPESS